MSTDDPRIFASTADAKRATGYAGFIDERLRIDGQRADATISDRILGAVLTRTMDSAASLELTLWDGDLLLLRSGLFDRKGKPTKKQAKIENFDRAAWDRFGLSEVTLDGAFFRLAGVSGQYGSPPYTLTVTFEDRIASLMRRLDSHVKASRSIETRAEFLHWLARRAMLKTGIPFGFYSPEEGQRQKPKKPDTKSTAKGLNAKDRLTVKAVDMDAEQRRLAEIILTVADDLGASERATLAAFCAAIGENVLRDLPINGLGFGGVFQGAVSTTIHPENWFAGMTAAKRTEEEARSFFKGGRGYAAGGAMGLALKNPDMSPGTIATTVEGSGQPGGFYDKWIEEAKAILDAWGGVAKVQVSHRQYQYEAGGKLNPDDAKNENYWAATKRLTDEVRWRRWASENILWYVTDEWLFQRRPVFVLDDGIDTDGLTGLTFDADIGVPIGEIRLSARTARWEGAPGAVVSVRELGPLSGRWLTWEDVHDCLRETSDITLHRPAPKLKEQAATPGRPKDVSPATDTLDNGLVYPLAVHGTDLGGVAAHAGRAWHNWQSDNAVDIGCPLGTAVYAVTDGTITRLGGTYSDLPINPNGFNVTFQEKGRGRRSPTGIQLTVPRQWFYTHLRKRAPGLNVGDKVTAGQYLGETGQANGVKHLHIASSTGDPEALLEVKTT